MNLFFVYLKPFLNKGFYCHHFTHIHPNYKTYDSIQDFCQKYFPWKTLEQNEQQMHKDLIL